MKQTSIEWLINELDLSNDGFTMKIINKAKQMHKEEIEDAFGVGCQVESTRLIGYQGMAEQYYQETYGGNK